MYCSLNKYFGDTGKHLNHRSKPIKACTLDNQNQGMITTNWCQFY